MLQHNDFSAWIETEGIPTQEYNVEITSDAQGPVVTCWIASEEAKTFSVNLKDASSASTCWALKADGVEMKKFYAKPAKKGHPSEITHAMRDMAVSTTERNDDAYMHRSIDAKFGEITLSVWSTQQVKYRKAQLKTSAPAAAPVLGGPIHEKSKKMGGHCISYGQPVPILEKATKSSATKLKTHYWERVKCLVSFSFKYRPLVYIYGKALLQANGIAPLPPAVEPTSASSERSPGPRDHGAEAHPVDTGEVDLLRQQLQLIQKRLDEIDKPRGVKREFDAAEQKADTKRKRVKTEGQVSVFISVTPHDPPIGPLDIAARGFLFTMLVSENLSAWVEIEGIPTQEYNIKVKEDPKHVTCWIASEEGKSFRVHIKDTSCRRATCWTMKVDGVEIDSPLLVPPPEGECERTCCIKRVRVSPTELRALVFSRMSTTDDDDYLERSTHLNLGSITLDVWTAQRTERTCPDPCVQLPNELVHERSKKSGTHCIGFYKYGTSLGAVKHKKSTTVDLWDCIERLATFSFNYRPLALLQANGIAPAPPPISVSPDPEENDGDVSAEEEELKHQMQIMQQRLAELEKSRGAKRVKEEPDTAVQRNRKRVKKALKSAFVPGEVIDLTSE
ncbi:hypothetical protein BDN71DRAFT_1432700 [Pleurotus eryngii]|uniref:DUF7918 domain-containing protein n=1 Tax=Pleurotus eryngii TaxID=5323 RepID=A0A9P5ZRE7_PLEER|nr:hypothetical protein BDN71DRAFT_1432700 [Pleurotus eryngii]